MVFTIPIEEEMDSLYLFYDGTQVENAEISVDGYVVKQGDVDGYILSIGQIDAGSTLRVSFELKGETPTGYVRLSAADLNTVLYESLADKVTSQSFEIEKITDRHISGRVTAGENQTLFFSIPYDKGWDVLVDGERVEAAKIGDAFLAVPLTPGDHEISLTFTPVGFSEGMILSFVGFGIFVGICVLSPFIRKKRKQWENRKNEEIPSDEELNLL